MARALDQHLHILLPREDIKRLRREAREQHSSLGQIVREVLRKAYGAVEPSRRRSAFARLAQRSELAVADWPEMKQEILRRHE